MTVTSREGGEAHGLLNRGVGSWGDISGRGGRVAQGHDGGERVGALLLLAGLLSAGGHGVIKVAEHGGGAGEKNGEVGDLTLELLAGGSEDLLGVLGSKVGGGLGLGGVLLGDRTLLRVRCHKGRGGDGAHVRERDGGELMMLLLLLLLLGGRGRGGRVQESGDAVRGVRGDADRGGGGDVGGGLRRDGRDRGALLVVGATVVDWRTAVVVVDLNLGSGRQERRGGAVER